jgi:hypothetical protein
LVKGSDPEVSTRHWIIMEALSKITLVRLKMENKMKEKRDIIHEIQELREYCKQTKTFGLDLTPAKYVIERQQIKQRVMDTVDKLLFNKNGSTKNEHLIDLDAIKDELGEQLKQIEPLAKEPWFAFDLQATKNTLEEIVSDIEEFNQTNRSGHGMSPS